MESQYFSCVKVNILDGNPVEIFNFMSLLMVKLFESFCLLIFRISAMQENVIWLLEFGKGALSFSLNVYI